MEAATIDALITTRSVQHVRQGLAIAISDTPRVEASGIRDHLVRQISSSSGLSNGSGITPSAANTYSAER